MNKFALCLVLLSVFGTFAGLELRGSRRPITDETELSDLTKKVTTHLKKVVTGENAAPLEFGRIHSTTYQLVAGHLYGLFAGFKEKDHPLNCTISLWEKPWIVDFVKLDLECGEEKRKYQFASGQDDRRKKRQIASFGRFSDLSENSAKNLHSKLTAAFDHLKTKKPHFDLTFKRVVSGKSQVVSGFHYRVTVEATNTANELKTCEAYILGKLNDEVVFDLKCDNQNHHWTKQSNNHQLNIY